MTVEVQTKKVTANGNDVATSFSFSPIVIFQSSDLVVIHTDADGAETTLSEGSSSSTYSVSVSTYPGTGSITYPASGGTPLPTGESLTIKRELTLEQTLDLENQGGYHADNLETALDKLLMIDLQQQEELDRCVKVEISSGIDPDELISSITTSEANASASATAAASSATSASSSATAAAASETAAAASAAALELPDPAVADTFLVRNASNTEYEAKTASQARAFLDVYTQAEVDAKTPAGVMVDYAGAGAVPTGYLLCDGSNVSRTTYAALFTAIGTTWGVGDGSTTFGLPDTRRRVSVGSGGTGTAALGNAVGDTGGEEDHTLTAAEAPVMTTNSQGAHTHTVQTYTSTGGLQGPSESSSGSGASGAYATSSNGAHTHTVNSGGGDAHNNMQPSYVVQKIIKT